MSRSPLYSPLSLYDKTIRFSFPFSQQGWNSNFKFNTVDFNSFPSSQGKHGIVEGRASVGTNIKMPAIWPLPYLRFPPEHELQSMRHGIYILLMLQSLEDSFQSLSLVEEHVCVAVSIFNTDNHVVNDCHTWTIAH